MKTVLLIGQGDGSYIQQEAESGMYWASIEPIQPFIEARTKHNAGDPSVYPSWHEPINEVGGGGKEWDAKRRMSDIQGFVTYPGKNPIWLHEGEYWTDVVENIEMIKKLEDKYTDIRECQGGWIFKRRLSNE